MITKERIREITQRAMHLAGVADQLRGAGFIVTGPVDRQRGGAQQEVLPGMNDRDCDVRLDGTTILLHGLDRGVAEGIALNLHRHLIEMAKDYQELAIAELTKANESLNAAEAETEADDE